MALPAYSQKNLIGDDSEEQIELVDGPGSFKGVNNQVYDFPTYHSGDSRAEDSTLFSNAGDKSIPFLLFVQKMKIKQFQIICKVYQPSAKLSTCGLGGTAVFKMTTRENWVEKKWSTRTATTSLFTAAQARMSVNLICRFYPAGRQWGQFQPLLRMIAAPISS